jgi:predicted ATPase
MLYLKSFAFPDDDAEIEYLWPIQSNAYESFYPFKVLSARRFHKIEFEPVTVLYGGNGSGKSTALNVIAEKTKIRRDSIYNKTNFYPDYIKMCSMPVITDIPENSRIITSDDVFDYMLDMRSLNEGIDNKREGLFDEYSGMKKFLKDNGFQMKSLEDHEQLKKFNRIKKTTQSKFVRSELIGNVREYSNGESAYRYFTEKIGENGLYVLDEPENSLSPKRQIELAGFIEDSARFYECQFIISTHSPFFLAMKGAKIYDLDANPVATKRWTELENMRIYHEFFKLHENKFMF